MADDLDEGVVVLLAADVEGSTEATVRLGDRDARELLGEYRELFREQVSRHGGREVDAVGDGFMASFASARRAITCATTVQRALTDRNDAKADRPISVRMGLNVGEVLGHSGQPFGAAINGAARVMSRARGGEVLAASAVIHLAGSMPGLTFRDRGLFSLKGFQNQWQLYEVVWSSVEAAQAPSEATALAGAASKGAGVAVDVWAAARRPRNLIVLAVGSGASVLFWPWLLLAAVPAYALAVGATLRHIRASRTSDEIGWRTRGLLRLAPTNAHPVITELSQAVFTAGGSVSLARRLLEAAEYQALPQRLAKQRELAAGSGAARERARSLEVEFARLQRLDEREHALSRELRVIDTRLAELKTTLISGITVAELEAELRALDGGVREGTLALDEAYAEALAHARPVAGRLRRTRYRGVYRRGACYVVPFEDSLGNEREARYDTLAEARATARARRLERRLHQKSEQPFMGLEKNPPYGGGGV